MDEKPLICVVGNLFLLYFLKCALHISSWRLKCYYTQRNSMLTDRENIGPGNLCIMKATVRYRQKAIFLLKNIYLCSLLCLASLNLPVVKYFILDKK